MRPGLEGRLPDWLDVAWWEDAEQLLALAPEAEIGWFDMHVKAPALAALALADKLQWLSSAYAGVDWMPLADFAARGIRLTCGSGLNANQVAEFAVMAMLAQRRGYRDVVRAQDRHEWLAGPPSRLEMAGTRALILGFGEIGQTVARMLAAFQVDCVPVRSRAADGVLGPDEWRAQLGSFDWVVLTLPSTPATNGSFGAAELAMMKADAVLVNYGRAEVVDQQALLSALQARAIGGAILDLTTPEPLPSDHPLWACDNAQITMHLCGVPTAAAQARAAQRFLDNCTRFRNGQPLLAAVDLEKGY